MDLMTATTSYNSLKHKYYDFRAPSAQITVDGVEITEKLQAKIGNLQMDLTCGYAASSCSFDILCEYLPSNTAFDSRGAYIRLQIGAKVEVALGYVVTETVFVGLVAEVDYCLEDEGFYFHVTCLDAKFLMMKNQRLEVHMEKKVSEQIGNMLSGQPFTTYITSKSIDDTGKVVNEMFLAAKDDYTIAVKQAQQLGYEFFILAGKVYYRKPPSSSAAIMSLTTSSGLLEARFSLRSSALYKTTEVVGINPQDGKPLKGEASIKGKFSKGSTASRMLGDSKKSIFLHTVADASDASSKAKEMMTHAQGEFGRLYGKSIGIPELVPGRSVKISGLMPEADTTFYLLDVHHAMDEDGFFTTFEAKVETL